MLGVIDKARVGSIIDSAYGYLSSVENFYIGSLSDDSEFELDGSYVIESGKLGEYDIAFSGNVPIAGRLTYENNDFVNGIIQYDDYYVLMYGGRAKVIGVPKNNSDGLYASSLEMDKGRYLYRGGNPNNYIWLDENGDGKRVDSELYRIISYEVDGTIRVIRNNSIGNFAWDTNVSSDKILWNMNINLQIRKNDNNSYCNYPNNYIWLDENGDGKRVDSELYRIISYEVDGTIKVVRNNSIGNFAWDINENKEYKLSWNRKTINLLTRNYHFTKDNKYCDTQFGGNVWGNQNNTYYNGKTLNELYNSFHYKYYSSVDSSLLRPENPNLTSTVNSDASLNIILNQEWLPTLKITDYIQNHPSFVNGIYYYGSYSGGDKKIEKEKYEQNLYVWNGDVGLVNITDFVESSLDDDCDSVWSNYMDNSNKRIFCKKKELVNYTFNC